MSSSPRRVWLYVVEATTILGVLISLGAWLWPQSQSGGPGTQPGTVTTATTGTGPTGTGTGTTGNADGGATVPLDSIPPDEGGANLGTLPKDLSADPAYAHALTVHCATNQTTDQFRRVRYQLLGRWAHLHLTVHAYAPGPDESAVQVEVFLDDQRAAGQTVTVGHSADVDAALDGVQKMELRITCQSPNDSAVLTAATLRHA